LIRSGRDNLGGTSKSGSEISLGGEGEGKWFFGWRQIVMVVVSMGIPVMISLLIVYGLNGFALDESEGGYSGRGKR
jgi:hypothetical protein